MLFENVKAILDMSKARGVDVLVAADLLATEQGKDRQELKTANEFIKDNYDIITKCRRIDSNWHIKKLCELSALDDKKPFRQLVHEIECINE